MAGATLATLSAILKDYYLPPVVEQLNNEVLLLQRLEKRDQELFGNQAIVPLHTGRSGGIGARPESGALPAPGAQSYTKAVYNLKYLYGRVRVSGPSMAKTASEAGAFLQSLKSELDGIRNDLRKDVSRQVYGDGTGIVAALTGVGTGTATVTLASDEPIRHGFVYVGMVVDIGTAANPTLESASRTITAVNVATPSITLDASITAAGTDKVFRAGAAGAGVVYEIDGGLQAAVSAAANTYGGINAATTGIWDNYRDTTGGALALDNLMKAYNQQRVAGGNLTAIITSFGLQRAFFNLLQSKVQYVTPTKLSGGFQSLDFQGMPLIADIDAPFGKIFFLDESTLKVFSNRDWHFLDEDGNVLKWNNGFDEWEAVLARYMNIGATRRNNQLVMTGLTDTTGI
jgi:hypothetical protein